MPGLLGKNHAAGNHCPWIPGVLGMWNILRIIMLTGFGKVLRAISRLMNVHGIECRGARVGTVWQPEKFRLHESAAVWGIIKFYEAADVGIGVSAPHPCLRLGLIVGKLVNECEAGSWLLRGVHDV